MNVQEERVKVAVRIRPLSKRESDSGHTKVVRADKSGDKVLLPGRDSELVSHVFDRAFDETVGQAHIYNEMVPSLPRHLVFG